MILLYCIGCIAITAASIAAVKIAGMYAPDKTQVKGQAEKRLEAMERDISHIKLKLGGQL